MGANSLKFVKEYKQTIAFAKLHNGGTLSPSMENSDEITERKFAVGDCVQWESRGVLQFEKPLKITRFTEDGSHAYVEGNSTGIPVQQLQKVEPSTPMLPAPDLKEPPKPGMRREVFALEGGEAVLQWPSQLTAESFEDLKDWLNLIIRKAERVSKAEPKAE